MSEEILFEEHLHSGATWSHVLKRGTTLTITDTEGGANVAAVFYNFEITAERLNIPDTLKAQYIARIAKPCVLYSDMGRILCSVVDDTLGWHDALGGSSNASMVKAKYGDSTYQQVRNEFHRNIRDSFLIEVAKYGLEPRDLCPNINIFSKVVVNDVGTLEYIPNHSMAGSYVTLRAEMNTLVVLAALQHPMDPSPIYAPKPVFVQVGKAEMPKPDDPSRMFRPENDRGFTLTERYFL